MSTKQNEINDKNLLSTYIKLENDTDDDLTYDNSLEFNNQKEYYSTLTNINSSLSLAYKGKIEVTSKGRRKIFDGVRWQILCRRPECRKQTNKKSLCITHYKEEYESNIRSSSSSSAWSNTLQSLQNPSFQKRSINNNNKIRLDIEDQNNTISTTNNIDNDEQISVHSNPTITKNNQFFHDGYIKSLHNGRRFILKNSKWQLLCKYDNNCHNIAKDDFLCMKHYELTKQKQRNTLKLLNKNNRRLYSSIFLNDNTKRLKSADFRISPTSITEQFDINSNENSNTSTEPVDNNLSSLTSNHQMNTSSKKHRNILSSNYFKLDKNTSKFQTDQSVQTDITIPLCCIIQQQDHTFSTLCKNHTTSTSSTASYDTKPEPKSFDTSCSI